MNMLKISAKWSFKQVVSTLTLGNLSADHQKKRKHRQQTIVPVQVETTCVRLLILMSKYILSTFNKK